MVGVGEVRSQQAKHAASSGDGGTAEAAWQDAAAAYEKALLVKPEALGSLSERNDVRYNYACCLVGCGRLEEAVRLLQQLMAAGAYSVEDVVNDPDLASLRGMF